MVPDPIASLAPESFAAFVAAHYRRLVGLLLLGGDDIGTAEELAQDALVRRARYRLRSPTGWNRESASSATTYW